MCSYVPLGHLPRLGTLVGDVCSGGAQLDIQVMSSLLKSS